MLTLTSRLTLSDGATLLIHILSLTTGAFHPEAKLGTIRIDDAVVPLRARFHSLQDGFIVFRLDGRHRIVVYSWKSGQFILVSSARSFHAEIYLNLCMPLGSSPRIHAINSDFERRIPHDYSR